jgi:hypothetical protein
MANPVWLRPLRLTPKVAVVDDGVDIDRLPRGASNVVSGESFSHVNSDERKPYYISASGRGTEVTNLILSTYPACSIYIARVDAYDDRDDLVLEAMAEVWNVA